MPVEKDHSFKFICAFCDSYIETTSQALPNTWVQVIHHHAELGNGHDVFDSVDCAKSWLEGRSFGRANPTREEEHRIKQEELKLEQAILAQEHAQRDAGSHASAKAKDNSTPPGS